MDKKIKQLFNEIEKKLVPDKDIDKNYQEIIISENLNNEINENIYNYLIKKDSVSLSISILYYLSRFTLIKKIISLFNNIEKKLESLSETYYKLGDFFFEEELYELSSKFYVEASFFKSNDANLLTRLGESYIKEYIGEGGFIWRKYYKLIEALFCLKKSLKINNKNSETYKNLGDIFYYNGFYSKSLEYFKKGLEISPDNPDLMNLVAWFYEKQKLFKESEDLYLKIIEKYPEYTKAYGNYGVYLFEKGLYEKSILYFEKILNLKKKIPHIYIKLAECYMRLKQNELAEDNVKKSIDFRIAILNKLFSSVIYFKEKKQTDISKHYILEILKIMRRSVKMNENCRKQNINFIEKMYVSKFYEIKDFYEKLDY